MPDVINNSLADELLKRNDCLQASLAESQIVDDVLNDNILKRKSASPSYDHRGGAAAGVSELHYLPKGRMEAPSEYDQRIGMTPWFPRLQQIKADRKGAMFSTPPVIKCDVETQQADFDEWAKHAFGSNKSFEYGVAETADLFQSRGFCGVFVDRAPLPADVVARKNEVSVAEKTSRKLGEARIVLYRAEQIYDFEASGDGLAWVRVVESAAIRATWNTKASITHTVRIIDAVNVTTYTVTEVETNKTVSVPRVTAHGFSSIPFIFAAPFLDKHGIGKSQLLGSAQAEVSSTRILSDIVWDLFLLGNPILTFLTDRTDEELSKLSLGATRYIPLVNGRGTKEPEKLEFCQLDSTGLELQFRAYEDFRGKIDELAGKDAPGATARPLQGESGISKAWNFKTGEERILFLITYELNRVYNRVLDFVAESKSVAPETIGVEFNYDFDIESPTESVDVAIKILPLVTESKTATAEIKKKMLADVYPDLPNMDKITTELDAGEADIPSNSNTDQLGDKSPPASTLKEDEEKEIEAAAAA